MVRDYVPGKTIPFNIDVVEPIGSETYVVGSAGEIPLIAGVGRTTLVKAHQDISLEPIVENLHLFDIGTEEAILSNARG